MNLIAGDVGGLYLISTTGIIKLTANILGLFVYHSIPISKPDLPNGVCSLAKLYAAVYPLIE